MKTLALVLALAVLPSAALAENHLMDNKQTVTYDCDKDAATNIMGNDNTITLKGACGAVNVSGNHNTISGAHAKQLNVTGNENTLAVTAAESINVSGNQNTLTYGKSDKAPKVTNSGKDNKIGASGK